MVGKIVSPDRSASVTVFGLPPRDPNNDDNEEEEDEDEAEEEDLERATNSMTARALVVVRHPNSWDTMSTPLPKSHTRSLLKL
jgi:hypothetical protein